MKFIYIENYLILTREEKKEFLSYLNTFEKFRVTNQKIILNDKSLILQLDTEIDSEVKLAQKELELFFIKNKKLSIKIVSKIVRNSDKVILTFENKKEKIVKL